MAAEDVLGETSLLSPSTIKQIVMDINIDYIKDDVALKHGFSTFVLALNKFRTGHLDYFTLKAVIDDIIKEAVKASHETQKCGVKTKVLPENHINNSEEYNGFM